MVTKHQSMTWAQRLKRVFGIEIETCEQRGGAVKVIACAVQIGRKADLHSACCPQGLGTGKCLMHIHW
ncbi:MAG: hypothetical protein ACI9CE_003488 [Flavobacterium sp.]|jgi:hypothetical protein